MISRTYRMVLVVISLCVIFPIWNCIAEAMPGNGQNTVVINEICDNNFSVIPLMWHESDDWIELYNGTEKPVCLEGWTISDSEEELEKYEFPDVTLETGERLLLYANGEGIVQDNRIFLNFCLSGGENVYLCDSAGRVADSVNVPEMEANTSFARVTDGNEQWDIVYPTLQSDNSKAQIVQKVDVAPPVFSLEGGFYSGSNQLELFVEDEDCIIWYTMDGSIPTEEGICYTEPILIENRSSEPNDLSVKTGISNMENYQYVPEELVDKITVIRAVAIDSAGNRSDVITHSYIVDIQNNPTYENMPIVSLTTNSDDFFNEESGLYMLGREYEEALYASDWDLESISMEPNYEQSGKLSEREANIEIYDANEKELLKQKVGIRIHGNSTRSLSQKSFSVYAREMYDGKETFNADVFGGENTYHKILLATDKDETKIKQRLHAELLKELNVDTQKFKLCNVFLNGEYWGVYWLAEVYDEHFIENYYNIPKEDAVIEDSSWPQELIEITENKNNLSDEELYNALAEKIDIESCIDYYASMIYIDHKDWFAQNTYMWKSLTVSEDNPYQDGKWRWMVYDTDYCERHYDDNTFIEASNASWQDDPIINTLMLDEEFRRQFIIRFMDIANTTFATEQVLMKIDDVYADYVPAMEAHAMRWRSEWIEEMDARVDKIRDFYRNRFDFITQCLASEFSLEGEVVPLILSVNDASKGDVFINTIVPAWENGSWVGYYFTDYPVVLNAVAGEGAVFMGWYDENGTLASEEEEITVSLKEENGYMAVFESVNR